MKESKIAAWQIDFTLSTTRLPHSICLQAKGFSAAKLPTKSEQTHLFGFFFLILQAVKKGTRRKPLFSLLACSFLLCNAKG